MPGELKRILLGRPIATKHSHHEKLPKRLALPVFASDALSSTAYATEEIMRVFLVGAGIGYMGFTTNIAAIIGVLIFIVAISYWQTIEAYPEGGGSYIVARDNLGPIFGQIAGAALMLDYVLTVSVSISAGVLAIVSMFPPAADHMVEIGLAAITLLTLANMRGAKESGILFAVPTYTFVAMMGGMIVWGLVRNAPPTPADIHAAEVAASQQNWLQATFLIVAFKAFSSGCAALTGIEAISDGAGAFRSPTARNASLTLGMMAILLAALFVGTSFVAHKFHVVPAELHADGFKTVVAMTCEAVFAGTGTFGNVYFQVLQVATALILFLAANTAYADFPRLVSFVARDGYLPRQLASLGDRLVFQNGIIILALAAGGLIILFKGDTHSLIPLYSVGVFVSFTMSQSGMVARARKLKIRNWKVWISLFGAIITSILAVVLLVSKWGEGAYLVPIALSALLLTFWGVRRHYTYLAHQLELEQTTKAVPVGKVAVLLLVPRLHKGILQAIQYSKALSEDVRAIHVTLDPRNVSEVKAAWIAHGEDIPLVILESPYRSLIKPIEDYVDQTLEEDPDTFVTVIVPEAVPKYPFQRLLHNNFAHSLRAALRSKPRVVISSVRYFLK